MTRFLGPLSVPEKPGNVIEQTVLFPGGPLGRNLWGATYGVQPMGARTWQKGVHHCVQPLGCSLWGCNPWERLRGKMVRDRVQALGCNLWGATHGGANVAKRRVIRGAKSWGATYGAQPMVAPTWPKGGSQGGASGGVQPMECNPWGEWLGSCRALGPSGNASSDPFHHIPKHGQTSVRLQ